MNRLISRALPLAFAAAFTAPTPMAQEGDATQAELGEAPAKLRALKAEFDEARQEWWDAYRQATTDEDRSALLEERPHPARWFDRFLAVADAQPRTEVAGEALAWIASHAEDGRPEILDRLAEHHADSPAVTRVCRRFWYAESETAREFLEQVMESSGTAEVKGNACYSLAKVWKNRADLAGRMKSDSGFREKYGEHYGEALLDRIAELGREACRAKAEKLMERVVAEHAELSYHGGRTLGEKAASDLFEMRHLAIGATAPEIDGESIHGEPMKLSDFRGKVVVLDFWGDW